MEPCFRKLTRTNNYKEMKAKAYVIAWNHVSGSSPEPTVIKKWNQTIHNCMGSCFRKQSRIHNYNGLQATQYTIAWNLVFENLLPEPCPNPQLQRRANKTIYNCMESCSRKFTRTHTYEEMQPNAYIIE